MLLYALSFASGHDIGMSVLPACKQLHEMGNAGSLWKALVTNQCLERENVSENWKGFFIWRFRKVLSGLFTCLSLSLSECTDDQFPR